MNKNRELSKLLLETADLLDFDGANFFRIRAYRDVADMIEHLDDNIESLYEKGELDNLSGIGKGMQKIISEFIKTNDFLEHSELLSKIPEGILDILKIPGIGSRKAKVLYDKLGISDIKSLEKNAKLHKIKDLDGFGEKTENNILEGIRKKEAYSKRIMIDEADEIALEVIEKLMSVDGVEKAELAGSLRRRKETIGDIDILYVSSRPHRDISMDFISASNIAEKDIIALGDKKTSVYWNNLCQVDLRSIDNEGWGAAMQYFTGSKEHNVTLRKYAVRKGIKVNEYGVWKDDEKIAGKTEKDLYNSLGMDYITPELRENMGEIDAAINHTLPVLVSLKDIKGDTHIHSDYSDGRNTIEEIAEKATVLGYQWIAVCDHSQSLKVANGLDEARLHKKITKISKLNKKLKIKILCGQEVDIKKDGTLDYPDSILKLLDIVIAAIHTGFNNTEEVMTKRILKAMENPYVNIIAHPTGRLINEREPYAVDIHEVIKKAAATSTILEINGHPKRQDLYYYCAKEASKNKVKLAIGTDSHIIKDMEMMHYGVGVARRGWLAKTELINTMNFNELIKHLSLKREMNKKQAK